MSPVRVLHIEAFSGVPGMGNPAGVVSDADGMAEETMQEIAKAVGFNETVFVCSSERADFRFRYFTPGHEMDLCGHATIAASVFLCREGRASRSLTIETRAGVLPVVYDAESGMSTMRQASPGFLEYSGPASALAEALGVDARDFHGELPLLYGSTGIWTLLVPVRHAGILARMVPNNRAFPEALPDMPRVSVHPFALAGDGDECDFIARHFSSPYSGTVEDPVTGTASGAMGAYAMRFLFPEEEARRFVVSQGQSVGRDGRVHVGVTRGSGGMEVSISGQAVYVGEIVV